VIIVFFILLTVLVTCNILKCFVIILKLTKIVSWETNFILFPVS